MVINIMQYAYTITALGLFCDFIGVMVLGYDLIRLQNITKKSADYKLQKYIEFEDNYGSTADWAQSLKTSTPNLEKQPQFPPTTH